LSRWGSRFASTISRRASSRAHRIPSHFVSDVTVEQGDANVVYTGKVEVNNSPLINGWYLHQTSYSELKALPRHEVEIKGPAGETATVEMSPDQSLPVPGIPGMTVETDRQMGWSLKKNGAVVASGGAATHSHAGGLAILADRFEPDFVLGADRQITSRSKEMNNPALRVQLLSEGQVAGAQWLFGREDMKGFSHSTDDHYKVELVDILKDSGEPRFVLEVTDAHEGALVGRVTASLGQEVPVGTQAAPAETAASTGDASGWSAKVGARVPAYATVMTLTSNPAIPIIYGACLLMMFGLVIGFFVRRRDVWFLLDGESGQLRVIAHYRHPSDQLDGATRAALARLQPSTAEN
jgi:cytochrome c biogenesis protein ResB